MFRHQRRAALCLVASVLQQRNATAGHYDDSEASGKGHNLLSKTFSGGREVYGFLDPHPKRLKWKNLGA